jgi:hypothetical protein
MGYRSEVVAVFYALNPKDLPVIKLWLEGNFPIKQWDNCIRWFDRGMVFEADAVKWYDNIPDVVAFNGAVQKFIDLFCDVDDGEVAGAYEFMRLGEEYEDIEVEREGDYHYFLDCTRSISVEI